jgi:hypothetical protein
VVVSATVVVVSGTVVVVSGTVVVVVLQPQWCWVVVVTGNVVVVSQSGLLCPCGSSPPLFPLTASQRLSVVVVVVGAVVGDVVVEVHPQPHVPSSGTSAVLVLS